MPKLIHHTQLEECMTPNVMVCVVIIDLFVDCECFLVTLVA